MNVPIALNDAFGTPLAIGDPVAFVGTFSRHAMRDSRSLKPGVVVGASPKKVLIQFTDGRGALDEILREPHLVAKRAV